MRKLRVFIPILLSMVIMILPCAYAENENPCKKEIAKFCKDIEPGEGRILRCLTLHEEDLTPNCKNHLARINYAVYEVRTNCVDDYAIFCSSVLPGQGRIAACLEKSKKHLTTKCRAILEEVKQKAREIQEQMQKK